MNMLLFIRDIIKSCHKSSIQLISRFFYVKRTYPNSIHPFARLDVFSKSKDGGDFILGKRSFIERSCVVNSWIGTVSIGSNSGIGINTILIGPILIGNNVRVSQNCFISGENRVKDEISGQLKSDTFDVRQVVLGDNVWVGAGSIILPGVTVGKNAIIGAGSVVTKDVSESSIVAGNPAKEIKKKSL